MFSASIRRSTSCTLRASSCPPRARFAARPSIGRNVLMFGTSPSCFINPIKRASGVLSDGYSLGSAIAMDAICRYIIAVLMTPRSNSCRKRRLASGISPLFMLTPIAIENHLGLSRTDDCIALSSHFATFFLLFVEWKYCMKMKWICSNVFSISTSSLRIPILAVTLFPDFNSAMEADDLLANFSLCAPIYLSKHSFAADSACAFRNLFTRVLVSSASTDQPSLLTLLSHSIAMRARRFAACCPRPLLEEEPLKYASATEHITLECLSRPYFSDILYHLCTEPTSPLLA
mmetsp:Transcript_17582/g.42912  ORF Transcript_17582/g.42912 Transcript_17582/m.42912 type:complete len:289 (+) Transcript_17582:787-1653(+)